MIYLDHAATTAPRREVLEAMWPWLTQEFGNASSHHERGQRAARALDDARERVAAVLGARPGEIIFTSGGTEADNLAVKGIALARRERQPDRNRVLISAIEHDAVLESARFLAQFEGFSAVELPVDSKGFVSPDTFRAALTHDDARSGTAHTSSPSSVAVASVMLANNEVGTVQNIPALAEIAAEHGVPLHTDAIQGAGALPLNANELGVSALSLAGHKMGTPQGIGMLWVKRGTPLRSLMSGGGHERGRRSGTSNVAGVVGLATALELAEREREHYAARISTLRNRLIDGILGSVPGALLTGPDPRETVNFQGLGVAANATAQGTHVTDPGSADIAAGASAAAATAATSAGLNGTTRLPTNASFCFPCVNGETVLVDLENQGVLVSSGSACATGSSEPSHVLTAMAVPAEIATTSVRFSLGRETTEADIDHTIRATAQIIAELRR